jgi:hypothetical protein
MRFVPGLLAAAILAAIVGLSANATDTVVRCGRVSEVMPASFVLTTPGNDPIKVVVPSDRQLNVLDDYICVSLLPGKPAAQFAGLIAPGMTGYVPEH